MEAEQELWKIAAGLNDNGDTQAIYNALREANAQAFEEAGNLLADGLSEDCGCSAELQSRCKAKAAALRSEKVSR